MSKHLYRALFEQSSDALVLLDCRASIVFANRAAERLFGYPIGALDGLSFDRLLSFESPTDEELFRRRLEQPHRGAEIGALPTVVGRRADGSEVSLTIDVTGIESDEIETDADRYVLATLRAETPTTRAAGELQVDAAATAERLRLSLAAGGMTTWSFDMGSRHLEIDPHPGIESSIVFPTNEEEVESIIHHDDLEVLYRHVAAAIDSDRPFDITVRGRGAADQRWLRLAGVVSTNEGSDLLHGIVQNVTPERATIERAVQQQRRLDLALQAGHLGIWELDTVTEEGWLDGRAKEMLGLAAGQQADFAAIAARVHPEDQASLTEQLASGLTASEPIESLYRVAHSDGTYRWIRTAGIPFVDPSTDHLRVIAINRDETELHENQQALADREQHLRLVLESTTTGVWDWDFENQTISFSDNWLEFFGYSSAEIGGPGWEWSDVIHPDDWPKAERRLREHLEGRTETLTCECRVLGADRTWRWTRMLGRVIQRHPDGRPIRVLGADTDITDERQMRSQLVHAGKMEALGVFAGGIAHDFNNVLAIIRGQVTFVLRDRETSPDTRRRLESIDASIDRSATLVRRLMLLGKPATDDPVHLDVTRYVSEMRKMLDELTGESIVLRVDTATTPLVVEIDAGRFEALLLNLVANARDAMPHGGNLDISVRSLDGGSAVELIVRDNGIGMDAETLEACFDPYFTTKPPDFGTGLGMATSYRTVTMAGGTISATSTEGEGTEIRVEFATVSAGPTSNADERLSEAHRPSTPATILIVEDDRELLELSGDLLRSAGHRVHQAFDAASALEVLSQHRDIDLLITDVVLPGMSGADLAKAATATVPGLKTLFVSGFAPATPATSQINRRHLLMKPVAAHDLLDAIAQRLSDA